MSDTTNPMPSRAPSEPDKPFTPPDPSSASRRITLRSKGSLRGSLVTTTDHRQLDYESTIERNAAVVLLARRDVVRLDDQPPAVAIVLPNGAPSHHTFDFRAHLVDGRRIAIAVKDEARAAKHDLEGFLRHIAPQIPRDFADGLALMTERRMSPIIIANAVLLHAVRRDPPNAADAAIRDIIGTLTGDACISDLVTRSGHGADGFRAVVRLIGTGDITLMRDERISYASRVAVVARTGGEGTR